MNGKFSRLLLSLFFLFILAGFNFSNQPGGSSTASLVLKDGYIYTVDGQRTVAEAAAIQDGRFIYVGSSGGVGPYIGKGTEVIDLGGRMVLPGFVDSHCHPAFGAAHQLFDVMFTGLNSIKEYQKAIRDFAASHPDAKFIKGRGWKNTLFGKTGPDKKLIDEIAKDIPVALEDDGGHSTWVNSKTLELAGITKDTKSPRSGVIEHDPVTGEPSGTLREGAARLIEPLFPDYTVDELMQAVEAYQKMAASASTPTRTLKGRTAYP
jgi:predicted amidohydrolase YtcJ